MICGRCQRQEVVLLDFSRVSVYPAEVFRLPYGDLQRERWAFLLPVLPSSQTRRAEIRLASLSSIEIV
jgi:hypothetical protein